VGTVENTAQREAGIVGQAIAFRGLSYVPLKDRRLEVGLWVIEIFVMRQDPSISPA
jgi:hypothetical protein